MLLLIAGLFLLALGLFAGTVLVAAALGLAAWEAGPVLWVLFPLFSISGYVLFVIGGRTAQVRSGSLLISGLLLLLAMASAAGLVMQAAAILPGKGSSWPLWYVMVVAGSIGVLGAASLSRIPSESTA
jgi:hypothetical protein